MKFFTWGHNPWGDRVLLHLSWDLLWVAVIAGLLFLIVHAKWVRFAVRSAQEAAVAAPPSRPIPEHVPRHTLAARLFHWIMAVAMLVLLFTAFLPIAGIKFAWVTIHWIAGIVLTVSILYHVIHASFWLDFWSIWPNRGDATDATRRLQRTVGQEAPPPRKHAKYPLENKLYHLVIVLTGLGVIATGLFMMVRIRTPLFPRNPYLFSDQTWGFTYVLHGLAGVGLVALVMAHIYFAVRPEKLWITNSMIFGWIRRDKYLEHHDPDRWVVPSESSSSGDD